MVDLATAELGVLCVVVSYAVCVAGPFVFNYIWTAPSNLHSEQQAAIEHQKMALINEQNLHEKQAAEFKEQVSTVEAELQEAKRRKHTPAEEHRSLAVRQALKKIGPGADIVLRHLIEHGELEFGHYNPPLPKGMRPQRTQDILNQCVDENLATMKRITGIEGKMVYSIAPGMRAALEEHLYPQS